MDTTDRVRTQLAVGRVFTPTTPIDESSLFAGRAEQLTRVVETVAQRGQHAIIFGERGVGKTSLANVLAQVLKPEEASILAPRATADSGDTYDSLWRKIFGEIPLTVPQAGTGFLAQDTFIRETVAEKLPGPITPDLTRRVLTQLGSNHLLVVIIDEFDRLAVPVTTTIADTVKMLSDHAVPATLVLVGVADSVDQLIREHASIERALVQVPMPRMSAEEIREIITRGLHRLNMTTSNECLDRVVLLAQGLPHYAHLLGLYATLLAAEETVDCIAAQHVEGAIARAVENAQMSVRTAYSKAVASPRAESLYSEVLLACALAPTDDLGYFTPAAVREPMTTLMGRCYDIPSFARHLYDFTEEDRGSVLERTGSARRYRYRFRNPLLQPYIIMRGLAEKRLDEETSRTLLKK